MAGLIWVGSVQKKLPKPNPTYIIYIKLNKGFNQIQPMSIPNYPIESERLKV